MRKSIVKALAAAVLACVPALAQAQSFRGVAGSIPLFSDRDETQTVYDYCATYGPYASADAWDPGYEGSAKIQTSGSSTTVTAVSGGPFNPVSVGDELIINYQGVTYYRYVATRASGVSITVNAAIDLTNGASFSWRKLTCGTTANDGWVSVKGLGQVTIIFQVDQLNATSVDASWECKVNGSASAPVQLLSKNYTSASFPGNRTALVISSASFDYCRLGSKLNTDTGVQKFSGYIEAKRY